MFNKTLWFCLLCFALLSAITNFTRFAGRPSQPPQFKEERAKEADALISKIDAEQGDARRADQEKRLWLLLESAQRQNAHDYAASLSPSRPKPDGYDEAYVKHLHSLSVAELYHDCVPDMLHTFRQIYDYDREHLAPNDRRLYRDCCNLGLGCFLVGQSSASDGDRLNYLTQANDWLKKAEDGFGNSSLSDLVGVKENELMVAEALKDTKRANSIRHQVDELLVRIDGPAPRVTL